MRSIRGLVAAVIVLLTVPVAIGVALATGGGAEPIIHFGIGAGMLLLAVAAFDFGLPRWIAWYGAATAGAFGGIFVLQGIADAIGEPNLWHFAFSVLGQQPERLLPELIVAWFIALLVLGSQGRTRIFGTIVIGTLITAEVITHRRPSLWSRRGGHQAAMAPSVRLAPLRERQVGRADPNDRSGARLERRGGRRLRDRALEFTRACVADAACRARE